MRVAFLGAAGTVTGSKTLVEAGSTHGEAVPADTLRRLIADELD